MAIHKTKAIVLDRKDYRETSFLINLFTEDFGKISAQAKGARRKIGKFGTNFLPLTHNTIVFYENPRSDLHIISQADMEDHFPGLNRDLKKLTCASYFLELVNTSVPYGQKNEEVFNLLMNFLNFLDKEDTIKNLRQIFEIKFLNLSGFRPRLDCCVNCGNHLLSQSRFSFVLGGLLCAKCYSCDQGAQRLLQGTIASINYIEKAELEKMINFKMVEPVAAELERILRTFIDFHLGAQFKSLKFLKKMRFADV